jgi:hypothetical protein
MPRFPYLDEPLIVPLSQAFLAQEASPFPPKCEVPNTEIAAAGCFSLCFGQVFCDVPFWTGRKASRPGSVLDPDLPATLRMSIQVRKHVPDLMLVKLRERGDNEKKAFPLVVRSLLVLPPAQVTSSHGAGKPFGRAALLILRSQGWVGRE